MKVSESKGAHTTTLQMKNEEFNALIARALESVRAIEDRNKVVRVSIKQSISTTELVITHSDEINSNTVLDIPA